MTGEADPGALTRGGVDRARGARQYGAHHGQALPTTPVFQARKLSTTVQARPRGARKVLLDDVSFEIPDNSLVAILGPSGAGKTTLLHALTGLNPAESGDVFYNGRDVYKDYDEIRTGIGYVPQFDALHGALTLRECLSYAAALRIANPTERAPRVAEVMGKLGLTEHADTLVKKLSGGQRKRASVAMELLSKPGLIFLDEPTSGLDPGLDSDVMAEVQALAHDVDEPRIIFVVTHSLSSLRYCDYVLVMAPGGRLVAFDTPEGVLQTLQAPDDDPAEMFALLNRPDHDGKEYLALLADRTRNKHQHMPVARPTHRGRPTALPSAPSQFVTLCRRTFRVMLGTPAQKVALVLVPALLGGLSLLVGGEGPEGKPGLAGPAPNPSAMTLLLMLLLIVSLLSLMGSIQVIVEEAEVYRRERAVGQSRAAYLASKVLVVGLIALVQGAIVAAVAVGGQKKPTSPPVLDGFFSVFVPVVVLGLSVAVLGLALSALSGDVERSRSLMVVGVIVLVILSGAVQLNFAGKDVVQKFVPTSWTQNAMAAATNLNCLDGALAPSECAKYETNKTPPTEPNASGSKQSKKAKAKQTVAAQSAPGQAPPVHDAWMPTARNWWTGTILTLLFLIPFVALAWFALARYDPKRRRPDSSHQGKLAT